ncbi:MAG: hypothetical protein RSA00_06035 [Hydrogenoanaerobacterium sp.]
MLWTVCALHIGPMQWRQLPAGEKAVYRLLYNEICRENGRYSVKP